MLRTKAIRKIYITTLSFFIILISLTFINTQNNSNADTILEVKSVDKVITNSIYLLNDDNYLVKSKIVLGTSNKKEMINKIILNLMENNDTNSLHGMIPKNTKIREIIYGNKFVTVDFSKDILKISAALEKRMIEAIVYSVIDLGDIDGISILVEGESLLQYPNSLEKIDAVLDKRIGINKTYNITSRDNISKVVVYYVNKIDDYSYYVPVTKYVNDNRDKIKIIVEELSTNYIYESNLMSFLNSKIELLDYSEDSNVMYLNFNDYLFDFNDKLLEEVVYTISYSVFDNYDVDMVMFEVNGEVIRYIYYDDII